MILVPPAGLEPATNRLETYCSIRAELRGLASIIQDYQRTYGIMGTTMQVPSSFQGHLWSANVASLDTERHKGYIIEQLLEYGNLEEWRWLLKTYNEGMDIIPVLKRSRSISPRSKSFWAVFFHIDLPDAYAREGTPWWDSQSIEDNR